MESGLNKSFIYAKQIEALSRKLAEVSQEKELLKTEVAKLRKLFQEIGHTNIAVEQSIDSFVDIESEPNLETLKEELQQTQTELSQTKQTLLQTQAELEEANLRGLQNERIFAISNESFQEIDAKLRVFQLDIVRRIEDYRKTKGS